MQDIRQNANDSESLANNFSPTFIPAVWLNFPHKLMLSDKQTASEHFGKQSLKHLKCVLLFIYLFIFGTYAHEHLWFSLDNSAGSGSQDLFASVSRSALRLWPFVCCVSCLPSADEKFERGDFLSTLHNLHWSHGHNLAGCFFFYRYVRQGIIYTTQCGRVSSCQCVCSICVGCLPGSALLWIGHWRARAPRMQSDRCRLVGAWLQTARRQARYQRLEIRHLKKKKGLSGAAVFHRVRLSPLPWPLTPPSVCLHLMPWVRCCEWTK